MNASKEEKKKLVRFRTRLQDEQTTKSFCKEWASKLAEREKGYYYNQEKWLKDDKALEKPLKPPRNRV